MSKSINAGVMVLLLFFSMTAFGQHKVKAEPFIIQGKLTNCAKKEFLFFFNDPKKGYKDYHTQIVKIDSMGRFYLKTFALSKPTIVTLRSEELSLDFYAAPGYNLTLTGDARDFKVLQQQKKISGIGSEANKYLLKMDSIAYASKDTSNWYDMRKGELLQFINKNQTLRDSLYALVFEIRNQPDKWFNDFAKITRFDSEFMKLYYLISGAMLDTTLTYQQSVSFVTLNFNKNILANLYDDKYLISDNYKGWLMGTYPAYLSALALRKNSKYGNKNYEREIIEQVANNYKGKIRQIKLYDKMNKAITYCRSFEELNLYKKELPGYIALLTDKRDREKLKTALKTMEITLLTAQIGKPAPAFTVVDSTGVQFSSDRYKGKVIYIDLWASWCAPCRAETPHFKKLVEKYKNDDNVVFMSIAVMDKLTNWKNALTLDRPTWLQFFDNNGDVQKAYIANSIPKFILIDKNGNIVSFDAPMPSSGDGIVKLINQQLYN